MSQNLKAASAEVGGQPRELSPAEAYNLAEQQKEKAALDFLRQIVGVYEKAKAGDYPAGVDPAVVQEFVAIVDSKLSNTGLDNAVRLAYRESAVKHGLKQIDPNSPDFENDLKRFHENYVTNFPIAAEQESLDGFRDLFSAPTRADGFKEVAYCVICPFTGKFLMGTNFTIQPESNSVHFVYGFVMPWARGAIGFSKPLVDTMRNVANEHIAKYPAQYTGEPIITFEKNILGDMTLGDILMDTAGIDIHNPPRQDANLTLSSIDQSIRDLIWSRMGGKVVNYNYIQSSLEGVVKIENPRDEKLAIRFLNKDATLTAEEKQRAEGIMEKALDGREGGCTVLNLCVFVPPGATSVNAEQMKRAMETFQGTSVVKDPEGIKDDIYFKASMADLDAKTKDGIVPLVRIPAFGGAVPGVESYKDAAILTKLLLQNVTWQELRENSARPYAEWLQEKMDAVAPAFAGYKAGQTARQSATPTSSDAKPGS